MEKKARQREPAGLDPPNSQSFSERHGCSLLRSSTLAPSMPGAQPRFFDGRDVTALSWLKASKIASLGEEAIGLLLSGIEVMCTQRGDRGAETQHVTTIDLRNRLVMEEPSNSG